MTSCRADRLLARVRAGAQACIFGGVALAFAATSGSAWGQTPRSLVPTKPLEFKASPDSRGQPTPALAPLERDDASKAATSIEAPIGKTGISVDSLSALTEETVGVLDAGSGGFAADMWQGTPREIIESLITMLPSLPASRTLLDLRQKLLLSRAAVPPAVPPATAAPVAESLLLRRARALFNSGDLPSAAAFLAVIPSSHQEEALSKLFADVAFLSNDLARACEAVAPWVDRSSNRYWQKALVFCEALNGAWERVDFGMRLLIELDEDDEVFFTLMRAIGGEENAVQKIDAKSLRPLDVAMARAARAGLPDPGVETPAPWLIRAYLDDPGVEPAIRFALVENAEHMGIAEAAELAAIYESMQVSPELLESAASVAAADPGPNGRALLYRATRAQGSNFGKAQAIKQASQVAAERRQLGQMARVYVPLVKQLRVTSQLGWFAADGASLLLAVGDFEAARPWLGIAQREATFDPEILAAWLRIWPMARLAAGDELSEWRADMLQKWWDWIRETDPEGATKKAALLFGLLQAVEDPVPSTVWRGLITGQEQSAFGAPGLAESRALADAVDAGRVGESVSLMLITLGSDPLETVSPLALIDVVQGLYDLGMERAARRLAFEIVLAFGF
jgi:hypothetical protein